MLKLRGKEKVTPRKLAAAWWAAMMSVPKLAMEIPAALKILISAKIDNPIGIPKDNWSRMSTQLGPVKEDQN